MNTEYPDDPDGDVLHAMAESGIDMTQPLQFEFVVDAPGEPAAKAIEKDLAAAGHDATADYEDGDPEEGIEPGWVVTIDVEMVPEYEPIIAMQAQFQLVAEVHGGQVDGWGAVVDEPE